MQFLHVKREQRQVTIIHTYVYIYIYIYTHTYIHTYIQFLREESEQRQVTIIYATHIFDGLEDWATDLVFVREGKVAVNKKFEDVTELRELKEANVQAPLFR